MIKYFYLRQPSVNSLKCKAADEYGGYAFDDFSEHRGDPFACVAYRVFPTYIEFGLATVNIDVDKFSKKVARRFARMRLKSAGHVMRAHVGKLQTGGRDHMYQMMKALVEEPTLPTSVKKAARAWLFE
jgi:hypothetical protein